MLNSVHAVENTADGAYIRKVLDLLFEPADVVEARSLTNTTQRTFSGYFNDFEKLAREAASLSGTVPAVYVTVNPVDPSLLNRAVNRLQSNAKETTTDKQIVKRRWLLLDFDPKRPSGISSSDIEHQAAIERAEQIKLWLETDLEFPELVIADSGNGAHLLGRVDLPCSDQITGLFKRCIEAVALRFEDEAISVDRTVFNAARIWKLYGTRACKGDNTAERPHRVARIIKAPRPVSIIPIEKLQQLAAMAAPEEPRRPAGGVHGQGFDLDSWIANRGLEVAFDGDWNGGHKWILKICPWNSEHTNRSAYIIQFPSGGIAAGCHHNSCSGKGWHELREVVEPGWRRFEDIHSNGNNHSNGTGTWERGGSDAECGHGEIEWPDPQELPHELPPVPPMEPAMVPSSLRSWLCDIAERMQCPLDFPVIGAVVTMGALIGRQLAIRPKRQDDWTVYPNLWGGIVGRPGIMKTPALDEAKKPIQRLELAALKKHEQQKQEHEVKLMVLKAKKEELQKKIKDAVTNGTSTEGFGLQIPKEEELILRRFMVNDSTIEKLGELLNQNPNGLLLFRDELTGWLRSLDREGHENDRAFYLESWNGNGAYTYDRIGRGTLHIEAACVSILGGIQPGPLNDYLVSTLRGGAGADGLFQRFQLLVYPDDPGRWTNVDRWPDTAAKNNALKVFEDIAGEGFVGFVGSPGLGVDENSGKRFLRFSPPAQEVFDDWRDELENKIRTGEEHAALEAHLSKYRSLMPSLALIFHVVSTVADGTALPVSEDAAKRAAAWSDYLEAHARRIYHGLTQREVSTAHRLASKIAAGKLPDSFTARDVKLKGWTGLSDTEVIEAGLALLEELGWVRTERVPSGASGGRPSIRYWVNPKAKKAAG